MNLDIPRVMGILNITPDSFYEGSRLSNNRDILKRAGSMLEDGADILDVGAYSSRPGADEVTEEEELDRVMMALENIRKEFPRAILSLDTFRSSIAEIAIRDYAVDIINDIYGGTYDDTMFDIIQKYNVPYILMHMKGTPADMQHKAHYDDIFAEIIKWFADRKHELVLRGVNDIIIDPGFGFGKSIKHNFSLLNDFERFKVLDLPLLAGLSRKSLIWKTLDTDPGGSLTGTVVLNTLALVKGASIIRVHDVAEAVQTIKLLNSTGAC
ncbi:MAG TPA: dihydropteroate synthase [Bacteroidales bacterium]|nr:dihydropteroate synthase [Bacteroidales bacterium]